VLSSEGVWSSLTRLKKSFHRTQWPPWRLMHIDASDPFIVALKSSIQSHLLEPVSGTQLPASFQGYMTPLFMVSISLPDLFHPPCITHHIVHCDHFIFCPWGANFRPLPPSEHSSVASHHHTRATPSQGPSDLSFSLLQECI